MPWVLIILIVVVAIEMCIRDSFQACVISLLYMGSNCSFSLGNLELERGELLFPLLFMAVSYTQLDVYKRQVHASPSRRRSPT